MSENSSDSDSSCGWTVINHEGSDIETVNSENGVANESPEFAAEGYTALVQEEHQHQLLDQEGNSKDGTVLVGETTYLALEETNSVLETEKEKSPDDNVYFGAISDDSDIVTLEPPKLEEIGAQEEVIIVKDIQGSEDFNLGSSSSSQYTFCQPDTERWWEKLWKIPECIRGWDDQLKHHVPSQLFQVFPSRPSDDESSSDETSHQPSPTLRRRRARKKTISCSESEDRPPIEHESDSPKEKVHQRHFNSSLNKCIILALVIAVSMGFGHFYGTIQIQKRQELVRKIHVDELNGMKDYLYQCQQEQGASGDKSLRENLATCLRLTEVEKIAFETQKKTLATENHHLRMSLEKEEKALSSLQEELRKLREQIRNLEDKETSTESIVSENQKLKQHLEEEKQKSHSFLSQKETLLAEAQMLRKELEKERQTTIALREELDLLSSKQSSGDIDSPNILTENKEIETLRARLTELEWKLNFEQQRSDLWERLYVEAKDQSGRQENNEKNKGSKGTNKARKSKDTLFGSVKETFDAMKNSTKEFVRHHKEKIKQAKEAVKENLKKFSDSVKSTFSHFKDTTKTVFDEKGNKKFGDKRDEATKKAKTVYREYLHPQPRPPSKNTHHKSPSMARSGRKQKSVQFETFENTNSQKCSTIQDSVRNYHFLKNPSDFIECGHEEKQPVQFETFGKNTNSQKCSTDKDCVKSSHRLTKGCSGVFECAHQESVSLFNRVLDPVRIDEFNQLMQRYVQEEVNDFHHWGELQQFINKFFHNSVFIHDQMLFTDFVNDVKDYLEDMKEYQVDNHGVFEDLDDYIYRHFFGDTFSPQYGPSRPDKKHRMVNIENSRHRKQEQKYPQPQHYKREGKWHKHGRSNGRHTANLEIELGQLPFDPKY
ncbi:cell cycle progression protein 1 isoform X2 [Monodelphis domestica]|uniref:cell cycle progression protein 1 isoform X2 n=1 Tax=Monodelphis domestica TaxID=13616 RepID=UPI0024E1F92A|nr:cell cycle progression protein 1 isoform X2 [Monodelphis domestica]XP_056665834.1 cell cycle progression protein 1 isoform X2 [Monodelphis domestica]